MRVVVRALHRYKVEPYVVAADIYSAPAHVGRGGWTWYTGAAAWLYRAGLESILGFHKRGSAIRIDPCIPRKWKRFEIVYRHGTARYRIEVENPNAVCRGVSSVRLDGTGLPADAPVPAVRRRPRTPGPGRARIGAPGLGVSGTGEISIKYIACPGGATIPSATSCPHMLEIIAQLSEILAHRDRADRRRCAILGFSHCARRRPDSLLGGTPCGEPTGKEPSCRRSIAVIS